MLICILYVLLLFLFFFFKQKTAYEMRISDWSSDVCSSDLDVGIGSLFEGERDRHGAGGFAGRRHVTQMIDPLHLLLDHLGDGVLERLGRGAGINGVDRDRRRSERRELGYREPQDRQTANQHDPDGADPGEEWPVDELRQDETTPAL